MKKKPARGTTSKHAGTSKHAARSKHHPVHHKSAAGTKKPAGGSGAPVHTVAKHSQHPKPRKVTPGDVALCPAEAVAAAARLAGWEITDEDVLDLYARSANGPSSGFTIAAALTAAPVVWTGRDSNPRPPISGGYTFGHMRLPHGALSVELPAPEDATLILGVDLPGPHAVTVAPDGCWVSWGEHYDPAAFPDAVIEEAWAVSFA